MNRDLTVRIRRDGVPVHVYMVRLPEDLNAREVSSFVLDSPDGPAFTVEIEQDVPTVEDRAAAAARMAAVTS